MYMQFKDSIPKNSKVNRRPTIFSGSEISSSPATAICNNFIGITYSQPGITVAMLQSERIARLPAISLSQVPSTAPTESQTKAAVVEDRK